MMRNNMVIFLFAFLVDGVFGDTESVMEGHSVILHTNITKDHHNRMLWYFKDKRIALINGGPSTSCVYDGEGGRFRDRLKVDYETGSLTITDLTTEHAGLYEAEHIRINISGKTESLNRERNCDSTIIIPKSSTRGEIIKSFSLTVSGSGLSPAAIAGIVVVVGVVLLVAAAVFGCWKFNRSIFRKFKEIPTSA